MGKEMNNVNASNIYENKWPDRKRRKKMENEKKKWKELYTRNMDQKQNK